MVHNIRLLPTQPHRRFFCWPVSVGRFKGDPHHSIHRSKGAINEFNIHFVAGGKGYVEIDGVVHTMHAGSAFLFFPLEEQRYYSSEDEPWDVRWVHFYGDKLQEFMMEHGFHRSTLWSFHQLDPVAAAHEALYGEALRHNILHETKLSALTYAFLVEFMGQAAPFEGARSAVRTDRITGLLPRMQEKAREPFDLAYWAEQAGVSPFYFCKLFRNATRTTPLDFVTLCRMQLGKQLLLERPEQPVKEIAAEVGYSSASYFNKKFIEHEGMTPTEFRELYLKKESS